MAKLNILGALTTGLIEGGKAAQTYGAMKLKEEYMFERTFHVVCSEGCFREVHEVQSRIPVVPPLSDSFELRRNGAAGQTLWEKVADGRSARRARFLKPAFAPPGTVGCRRRDRRLSSHDRATTTQNQ